MTILKVEAIALRILPYSNTSHIVTWLAESGERVTTLIKGACRRKSLFQGQYDLFCASELLYYRQRGEGLHIARECALLEARPRLRSDWRAFGCASYVSQLMLGSIREGQADLESYRLARAIFRSLDAAGARWEAVFWFELQWLRHLGFQPQLRACTRCRRALKPSDKRLHMGNEGVVCDACASIPGRANEPLSVLRPDVLAIARRWQEQPQPRVMATTQCSPPQVLEFDRLLGMLLGYHLDHRPEGRQIAFQLMRSAFGAKRRLL